MTCNTNLNSKQKITKYGNVLDGLLILMPLLYFFSDSIEANVESAEVNVQSATQQLASAANYQVSHCIKT